MAISFYTKPSFDSFVEGVVGEDAKITKEYTYTANQYGFVVVSSCRYYMPNYDFEDSKYKISYFYENGRGRDCAQGLFPVQQKTQGTGRHCAGLWGWGWKGGENPAKSMV